MNRRAFLKLLGLASGGLVLGVGASGCANLAQQRMRDLASSEGVFSPNAYLTITPRDRVLLAMNKSEMGQAVWTGAAVLIAEELEVPLEHIEPFHATKPEFRRSFGEMSGESSVFGAQITGGSTSTRENYLPMREAGAMAREMLITAAAARWGVSRETCRAEAGAVLHPRHGRLTYGALTRDAARLELIEAPPLKDKADLTRIGSRVTRVDAEAKVTGQAIYGADFSVPGMVCARVLHPPTLGAQAQTLDADDARAMPGVVDIFAFERGVAVLAEKYWQARAAALKVSVTWGQDGVLEGLDTARLAAATRAQLGEEAAHTVRDDGDVDDVLGASDVTTLEAIFEAPYLAHAPMEPMNCTIRIQEDRVDVWAPNQSPSVMAEAVARVLGRSREEVHVETLMLGGGFGRRGVPDFVAEAALIAKRTDRPVQLIWTREDDTRSGYFRPAAMSRMRGAVDAEGRVRALDYHGICQPLIMEQTPVLGAFFPDWMLESTKVMTGRAVAGLMTAGAFADALATEGVSDTPYAIDHIRVEYTPMNTRLPVAFWRSVGHSFNAFMVETFIDELAEAGGRGPLELRRELLASKPRHLAVLEAAAALGDWGSTIEPGWGRGVAVHESFGTCVAQVVEASVVQGRITVRRVACAVDCGVILTPDVVRAQMESAIIFGLSAALDQRIDLVDGVIQQGNFDTYPVLRMFEAPDIEVVMIDSDEHPSGVGEPGLPPVAPALANAIFAATGVRLRALPMQPAWDEARA